MLRRVAPLSVLFLTLALAVASCDTGDEAGAPTQPAYPPPAPPELLAIAASSVAAMFPPPGGPPPPPCGEPVEGPKEGGTPTSVRLEDERESGAYRFDPGNLSFKVGETVNFTLTAETELHTFTVCELKVDESVDAGQTVTFSITFDRPGTFGLICIPHESQGMVATIVVQ